MYTASSATESVTGSQGVASSNARVTEWVNTLNLIRRDQNAPDLIDPVSRFSFSSVNSSNAQTEITRVSSTRHVAQKGESGGVLMEESEDDLDIDLAKAALETGTKAFEAQDWDEADSLFQEALRVLRQLSRRQRAFCDIFDLQYKLAVCAFHTQEAASAEEALVSLMKQSASSDEQRKHIFIAVHLLSLLYIRMGEIDRAKSECERALQARRRLFGKQSEAALESTALIAHIYVLLNNRPRAKAYLAMIPEECRSTVLQTVEEALGKKTEQADSVSMTSRSNSEHSDLAAERPQGWSSESAIAQSIDNRCFGPVSRTMSRSPAVSPWQSTQSIPLRKAPAQQRQSVTVTRLPSAKDKSEKRATELTGAKEYSTDPEVLTPAAISPSEYSETTLTFNSKTLSRMKILEKVGCQPRDRIEQAACDGDQSALTTLLDRKKDFWRSKLRKRVRPERVTALHFAALFGEVDMIRRLLASGFDINEAPYGYTTNQTPLKFAIGARQADTVEFLIMNGARPSNPDTWSTLAGQLMNRSWLMKTMSETEKEDKDYIPDQIIGIMMILLKHRWDVNMPYDKNGRTVLHQAVSFWTGSYQWDLNLRASLTSFLYEQGADHLQADAEGKTPYDLAASSGHQDLLLIFGRGAREEKPEDSSVPYRSDQINSRARSDQIYFEGNQV